MIRRDGDSEFFKSMNISKRGNIKIASIKRADEAGADTPDEAHNVLDKFDKSEDISQEYIEQHRERLEKGHDAKEVMGDFFKGLQKAKESKKSMTIKTAKLFRQHGIFKKAERYLYQDLEGELWKISEDRKHVELVESDEIVK